MTYRRYNGGVEFFSIMRCLPRPGTTSATATLVFFIPPAYSMPSLTSIAFNKSFPVAAHERIRALATPHTRSQISLPFGLHCNPESIIQYQATECNSIRVK